MFYLFNKFCFVLGFLIVHCTVKSLKVHVLLSTEYYNLSVNRLRTFHVLFYQRKGFRLYSLGQVTLGYIR